MAEQDVSGFDGDVTMPTVHGGEAFAWSLRSSTAVKNTSRYGGGRFAKKRGGMIEATGHVDVFLRMDAANTSPGAFDTVPDGSAITLQAATGCTYGGSAVFTNFTLDHTFADPAVAAGWDFEFNGTVTETWDEGGI